MGAAATITPAEKAKLERELDGLQKKFGQRGHSATEAKRTSEIRQALGLDGGGSDGKAEAGSRKPGTRSRAKYAPEITDAVRRAKAARGTTHGAPGAKQHVHVRQVVESEIEGDVSPEAIVRLAFASGGVRPSEKKLRELASGKAPKSDLQALRSLAGKMSDPFCKGRNLASILVAWIEQTKETK